MQTDNINGVFSKIWNFIYPKLLKLWTGIVFLFRHPENKISSLSKIVTNLILLSLIVLAGRLAWNEYKYDIITLEQFNVPEILNKYGINGKTVANGILDRLNHIRSEVKTRYAPGFKARSHSWKKREIIIKGPEYSLNIDSLIRAIQKFFGKTPFVISGEITIPNLDAGQLNFRLTTRAGDFGSKTSSMITLEKNQTANPGINQFYTYDEAIEKAAAFCLEKIHPYLLGLYYFQISKKENHGENAVKIYEIKLLADKTIKKEPKKPWGYNLRGLFELEYGDPNKAENFFSVSLKYSKNEFPAGHSGLGRVNHKYSTFGNAIEKFKFAIEHGEDDPEVFWLLAESYYLLKKYEDAKQACEELRKLIYNEDYENNCQRIDNRQYRPKKGEGRNRYFFSNPLH